MAKIPFRERLKQGPLLADGAMGTMLNQLGVSLKSSLDAINLSDPDLVETIHRQYIEAGAEILETNTFRANAYALKEFNLQDDTIQINEAGIEIARRAIQTSGRDNVYVAGSVGPLGAYLAPFGRIKEDTAYDIFYKQLAALIYAGADLIVFETFSSIDELALAIRVTRDIKSDIPIIASTTYTRDGFTLMGDTPATVVEALLQTSVDVIGVNCSSGPAQMRRILKQMRQVAPHALYSVMPNAGWPETNNGRVIYPATPDYFADYAQVFIAEGATVIGGCCGTTPTHIQTMRKAIDSPKHPRAFDPVLTTQEVDVEDTIAEHPTELQRKLQHGKFVVTVEMAPPKGFLTQKVIAAADMLHAAGVDTINVSDSPMARMRMSPWAMAHLIQDRVGMETVLHFPTRGRNILRIQGDLLAAHALGVRNIFVVMGDPTHIGDYPDAFNNHDIVPTGLIRLIKQKLNAGLDEAGNAIREATQFHVGTALNLNAQDLDKEVDLLHKKIEAGADFALTQPIYEAHLVERLVNRYEEKFEPLRMPILVGVLPLYGTKHAMFLDNEVPGIDIPAAILQRIDQAEDSAAEGVKIAQELLKDLRQVAQGAYLMPPFAKYHIAAEVVEVLAQPSPI
jgi:homocysteine S-methyltransferase